MGERITMRQFHDTVGDDWRVVGEGACAYFRTGSFAAGARLVAAIGELPGLGEHHPDVDVRDDGVTVWLITITDDWYGPSEREVDLARRISAVARELGATADPGAGRPGGQRSLRVHLANPRLSRRYPDRGR